MSASPPAAAQKRTLREVREVPKPVVSNRSKAALISISSSARASNIGGTSRPNDLLGPPKPQHPLSAMSYCHVGFDWSSEAIANAVGGKCISYVTCNLCLCRLIQASNCCCDRGC